MPRILFEKAATQVSEKTGKPYTRNVRYDEVATSYFGKFYPPKKLWEDQGESPPEQLTVVFE